MRIGIDVSQIAYRGTGVATYVKNMVRALVKEDIGNYYVLIGFSLRQRYILTEFFKEISGLNPRVSAIFLPIPQTVLRILWNDLHIIPVEWITGKLDIFWASDWTTPPLLRARGITTIHDLIVFRFPEQFDRTIVSVQKKRLALAAREYTRFLCDSESTASDAGHFLSIPADKLRIIYPGVSIL